MIKKDNYERLEQILVTTDYSAHSFMSFPWAAIFTDRFCAKILIVPVMPQSKAGWMTSIPGNSGDNTLKQQYSWMKGYFISSTNGELNPTLEMDTLVRVGHAAYEIIETAKASNANMIGIGCHSMIGLTHVFLRIVAVKEICSAPCPVFTVKPNSFKKNDISIDEIDMFLSDVNV